MVTLTALLWNKLVLAEKKVCILLPLGRSKMKKEKYWFITNAGIPSHCLHTGRRGPAPSKFESVGDGPTWKDTCGDCNYFPLNHSLSPTQQLQAQDDALIDGLYTSCPNNTSATPETPVHGNVAVSCFPSERKWSTNGTPKNATTPGADSFNETAKVPQDNCELALRIHLST